MEYILKFIMLIIACYFIFATPIKNLREFKNKNRELRLGQEENLPREGKRNGAKISYFMFGSSLIIAIVDFYLSKVKQSFSDFVVEFIVIFIFEIVILNIWESIKQVISCYKKYGLIKTIFFTVFTILGIALVLYVKYSR